MLLRYAADRRSIAFMIITTTIFIIQWYLTDVNYLLYSISLFFSVAVAIMAHNHNHLPMWKKKYLNVITDYWLTLFYGFPAFGWIPTHNKNHHFYNNKSGDYTITYRCSEKNNMATLMSYPSISSFHQQKPIADYLKMLFKTNRTDFYGAIFQYVALGVLYILAFYFNWHKAIILILIPHQFSLISILIFNYVQHVHADEESDINHSRNFVGPMLNAFLFNNGFHTVHHDRAGTHWSLTPDLHKKVADKIDPVLNQKSFWGYMIRAYVLGIFSKNFKTDSMRLRRLNINQS